MSKPLGSFIDVSEGNNGFKFVGMFYYLFKRVTQNK